MKVQRAEKSVFTVEIEENMSREDVVHQILSTITHSL